MSNANRREAGGKTLTLAMIVRDEEATLGRCLRAAQPWVDEMVIVDTGSIDRTKAIAEEFGARVFDFPWNDSFADARNHAIEQATGDWILSLDADEVLDDLAGQQLREALQQDDVIGCFLPLYDLREDGRHLEALMFRAFQRRDDMRWKYRIHEQILERANELVGDEGGMRYLALTGRIVHDGYTKETMEVKGKDERNHRLFELQLEETPDDPYVLYKFADSLRREPDGKERAIELFERGWEVVQGLDEAKRRTLTYAGDMCGLYAIEVLEQGDIDLAQELVRYGLANCRATANLHHVSAHVALRRGRGAEAEMAFREIEPFISNTSFVPATDDLLGWRREVGLVDSVLMQGDTQRAVDMAWEFLEADPERPELVRSWARAEQRARDVARFTRRLIERVQTHPLCGESWLAGGELFFGLRLYTKALPWIMRAGETLEEPDRAASLQGDCMLVMGHHPKAIEAYSQGLHSADCRAGILLMSIAYGLDIEMEVEADDEELSDALTGLVRRLRRLGETRLSRNLREALLNLEATHPTAHEFLERALA